MKNCVKCGKQLINGTKTCTLCGATQTPKGSKTLINIGIIAAALLSIGLTYFVILICMRTVFGLIWTEYYKTNEMMTTSEGKVWIEYQKYEDDYLSYKIPSNWETNDSLKDDSIYLTGFQPSDSTTNKPSNINITINSFENGAKLDYVDFGDDEIKRAYRVYLLSQVGKELPEEAIDGFFSVITIGDHYVYTLIYDRKVGDTIVHQKIYFLMDFDYVITIYATDWLDGEQPTANQVAEYLIATLEIK